MKGALRRIVAVALAALAALWSAPVRADVQKHIRVVLDTSSSMNGNDPKGLAKLATLLLHDLSDLHAGDSFEVIPFARRLSAWAAHDKPPPTDTGAPIAPIPGRGELERGLESLRYDAETTFFYAGLKKAIEDLEKKPAGLGVARVVVVLTDGVPIKEELPDKVRRNEAELDWIRRELRPEADRANIRVYAILFGPESNLSKDEDREFFTEVTGQKSRNLVSEPKGDRLLDSMMDIFRRTFGYTLETPAARGGPWDVDIGRGVQNSRAAVVVYHPGTAPPDADLRAPSGQPVSQERPIIGRSKGASYGLRWVLSAEPGKHHVESAPKAPDVALAVLRPAPVDLAIRGVASGPLRVMAGRVLPLTLVVSQPGGAKGDPGPVAVIFRTTGAPAARGGDCPFDWCSDRGGPSEPDRYDPAQGRLYPLRASFKPPPRDAQSYTCSVEVVARREDAEIATLLGPDAPTVEVFAPIAIAPAPADADATVSGGATRALHAGDEGCATFTLVDKVSAPHAPRKEYKLWSKLRAIDLRAGPLAGAQVLLDGKPLAVDGAAPIVDSDWALGPVVSAEKLFGEHQVCLLVGRPETGTPAPLTLTVQLRLDETPYDQLDVIQPFVLKVSIAPPSVLERHRERIALAIGAAVLLGLLWASRARPRLPRGLRASIGPLSAGESGLSLAPLGEPSLRATLLRIDERPVLSPSGDEVLGWVRADTTCVYCLRPAPSVTVSAPPPEHGASRDDDLPERPGVRCLVRARSERGDYLLRLEHGT